MNAINIGKRLEPFWDDFMIDTERTTAFHRVMNPTYKGEIFTLDCGYEKAGLISYPVILKDDKGYKMYYSPWVMKPQFHVRFAVIESTDGINWTRPNLAIFSCPELDDAGKPNNVVLERIPDGFSIFYDTNPDCPQNEKYKAIGAHHDGDKHELWCYTSGDGYHFTPQGCICEDGTFDSANTIFWKDGKYHCFFRGCHPPREDRFYNVHKSARDIRVTHSTDFKRWEAPKELSYVDGEDFELYINNIMPYERAPHILVGFPARYCEREKWTDNFEQLGCVEEKKESMQIIEARVGLAVSDGLFMTSRDGYTWTRYAEPFVACDIETSKNWMYGDCYLAYGMVEASKDTYYMYAKDNSMAFGKEKHLGLYEIRKDGFACIMADSEKKEVVTKPFIFEGSDLHLNFSTSAFGHIYVDLLDEEGNAIDGKTSFEIFGNSTDRRISFEDGSSFKDYAGKPIRLRFRMRMAKLFSMWFD